MPLRTAAEMESARSLIQIGILCANAMPITQVRNQSYFSSKNGTAFTDLLCDFIILSYNVCFFIFFF